MKKHLKWSGVKLSVYLFFRSLGFRWGLVACLIILPMNILTVVITNMMYSSYLTQMTSAYDNQIEIYADAIRGEFERTSDSLSGLLDVETMAFLNLGSKGDATIQIEKLKDGMLGQALYGQIPKMCYIWERDEDIFTCFNYCRNISMPEMKLLESYIRGQEINDSFQLSSGVFTMENNMIVFAEYNFKHVSFGVGYDVYWLLNDLYSHYASDGENAVYLIDADGCLMARYSETGFEIAEDEINISEFKDNPSQMVFVKKIDAKGRSIAHVTYRSGMLRSLPLMIRVLYVLAIISLLSLPVMIFIAVKMIIRPLRILCEAMKVIESGDLQHHVEGATGSYELDFLYGRFNRMIDEIHSLVVNSYEKEIKKLQSDAVNMRLQVNQHMLLNYLNTIYSLSLVGDTEQIGEFTQLLMKYFRYVLRQDTALVTVCEEMNFVKDYLKLQRIRFPDCFTTVYSVADEASQVKIPQLLIENFVENAVKYGLIMGSEIEILINIRVEDNKLLISVCDTGNGMTEDVVQKLERGEIIENSTGKHIGIWNCRRRMQLYYGDAWAMRITSREGEGTQIWLELPIQPLESEEVARSIHIQGRTQER